MKIIGRRDKSDVYKRYNEYLDEAMTSINNTVDKVKHIKGLQNIGYYDVSSIKCELIASPIELLIIKSNIEQLSYHL